MTQSLAQKRAQHAMNRVKRLENKDGRSNYVSYVRSLPAKIIMSGLGQALAMEKSSSNTNNDIGRGHGFLYEHLNEWLCTGWETSPYKNKNDILEAIINGDQDSYIRAQGEAMAYLEWLKKFAVAYLKVDSQDNQGDEDASAPV